MASKQKLWQNVIKRIERGKQPETRSRMARNRKHNYVKELDNGQVSSSNQ